ncbi:MAG: FIST N-terminal domain-containing protein [Cyanobacteria bacterium P01_E01_bin.6]
MFNVIVGHSNDPDSKFAIEEVLEQCQADLADDHPQAALLFAAPDFDHDLILRAINQQFPGIHLIGGTSDAELSSVLDFQEDSLTLTLFCSDEVEFYASVGRELSKAPFSIAQQTAEEALTHLTSSPKLCITIPESLTASGVDMLQGLTKGLTTSVPIVGGTTTDQWKFQCTYQFFCTEILQDSVPILLMSGNLSVGYGVATGWTPMGKKGVASKVDKNILYEVDHQPVLKFYKDYLGAIRPSPEYRLAVFESEGESWYVRTSNGHYDEEQGSITFFADIPEHSFVQVVGADRDDIIASTQYSMKTALENYPGNNPSVALIFSCTGRMQLLGTRIHEELAIAQAILHRDIPYCGFYTYGEISPLGKQGESRFHNESFVTLLIGVD